MGQNEVVNKEKEGGLSTVNNYYFKKTSYNRVKLLGSYGSNFKTINERMIETNRRCKDWKLGR